MTIITKRAKRPERIDLKVVPTFLSRLAHDVCHSRQQMLCVGQYCLCRITNDIGPIPSAIHTIPQLSHPRCIFAGGLVIILNSISPRGENSIKPSSNRFTRQARSFFSGRMEYAPPIVV